MPRSVTGSFVRINNLGCSQEGIVAGRHHSSIPDLRLASMDLDATERP